MEQKRRRGRGRGRSWVCSLAVGSSAPWGRASGASPAGCTCPIPQPPLLKQGLPAVPFGIRHDGSKRACPSPGPAVVGEGFAQRNQIFSCF